MLTWIQLSPPGHITTTLAPRNPKRYTQCGFSYWKFPLDNLPPAWENELPDRTIVGCPSNWTAINERNKARDTQCLLSESKDSLITSHVAARTDETWVRKMLVFDVGLLII